MDFDHDSSDGDSRREGVIAERGLHCDRLGDMGIHEDAVGGREPGKARINLLSSLRALEGISRRFCEGRHVDLDFAGSVVELLKDTFFQLQLESRVRSRSTAGLPPEERTVPRKALFTESLHSESQCFIQMLEAVARMRLEPDDFHLPIVFVNAAIRCMNILGRPGYVEGFFSN